MLHFCYISMLRYIGRTWVKVALRVEKTEKVEILQIKLILWVIWWENIIFYYVRKSQRFFSYFNMELFPTALSYLTAQSILNFTWTS